LRASWTPPRTPRTSAHASYAVYTARTDDPPADLLLRADVPALDPAAWSLAVVPLAEDAPLREVLSTLADERQPPIGRRDYPAVPTYRQAVLLDVGRDDSLHPDAWRSWSARCGRSSTGRTGRSST
jgi:hypothetical protein